MPLLPPLRLDAFDHDLVLVVVQVVPNERLGIRGLGLAPPNPG